MGVKGTQAHRTSMLHWLRPKPNCGREHLGRLTWVVGFNSSTTCPLHGKNVNVVLIGVTLRMQATPSELLGG